MARRRLPLPQLAAVALAIAAVAAIAARNLHAAAPVELLNVSYDPTRELYAQINPAFAARYARDGAAQVHVAQAHGGSSRQARRVAAGELPADVVTLGLPSDVDALSRRGLIAQDWATRLPNGSRPYSSTIVFVVRAGNPRNIRDWPDLIRGDIEIITPDPKSSGNGKLAALAAWGAVVLRGGSEREARDFLAALYAHAPFLAPAARSASEAFAREGLGDVHLTWENEALQETEASHGRLQIVYPPISILAEPVVAWVDAQVERDGHGAVARAYLSYLFTDEAQETIARFGYRPYAPQILARHAERFPPLHLFPIQAIAAGWDDAQNRFFADNGLIDLVYTPKPR